MHFWETPGVNGLLIFLKLCCTKNICSIVPGTHSPDHVFSLLFSPSSTYLFMTSFHFPFIFSFLFTSTFFYSFFPFFSFYVPFLWFLFLPFSFHFNFFFFNFSLMAWRLTWELDSYLITRKRNLKR